MERQTYVVAQTKQIFGRLDELEERLEAEPEAFLPAGAPRAERSVPRGVSDGRNLVGNDKEERLRLLEAGRMGLTKIRRAGDSGPSLTPQETIGLEAIILLQGRPALLIRNGSFEVPPPEWTVLGQYRATIEAIFPSVGRIEVTGHPRLDWVGTGFLVAPDVIMTNRHVALEFCERRRGEGWHFVSGISPRIDFREEHESLGSAEFACVEVLGIHTQVDLALLRVEIQADSASPRPRELKLQYRSPRGLKGRKVYVVGYPAMDGRRNDPPVMQRIFSDIYNVKRLQPGAIRNFVVLGKVFKHDCSTLGGNSGSCVVDLQSGKVLGLHFAGRYRRNNSAVALWKLRRSALLRRVGVRFD